MANTTKPLDADLSGETTLRDGSVDNRAHQQAHSADTELRLDDEKDTLYDDGLDVEDDSEQLAGTRAAEHRS